MEIHKNGRNNGNLKNAKRGFKRIFKLLVSTSYTVKIMETRRWPAKHKIQNATIMMHHNIKNSDEDRKIKKLIEEQEKKKNYNNFY